MSYVAEAPAGFEVAIRPPTRSLPQNAKFHAICTDVDGLAWYGKARDKDEWKTLFVSGHAQATGRASEIVEGLEGELVAIRESTARMSKERSSSLIEYSQAFAVQMLAGAVE